MKMKSIIFALILLILACSIGAIAAEDVDVAGHEIEVPDGYSITNTSDSQIIFEKDSEHAIVVIIAEELSDTQDSIKELEKKGYKFLGNDTYDAEGYTVSQQNYEKDGLTTYSYNFELDNGDYCVITLTIPSSDPSPEGDDNPINEIIDSIDD